MNLRKIDSFTMWTLPIHEHGGFSHLLRPSFSLISILQFLAHTSYYICTQVFYFLSNCKWHFFFYLFSIVSLRICRNTVDLYVLVLYPVTLRNSLSTSFLQIPSAFLHRQSYLQIDNLVFLPFYSICLLFHSLSLLLWLELPILC